MAKEKAKTKEKAKPSIRITEEVVDAPVIKEIKEQASDVVDSVELKKLQSQGMLVGCSFDHSVGDKVFYKVKCK